MSLWNISVEISSSSRVPFPPHSLGKGNHVEESYGFCYGISPSQLLAFVSVASFQMWPGANASLQWVLHEHTALGVSVAVFEALSTAPHNAHPKLLTQVHPANLLQGIIGTVTYWGILCLVKHTWNVLSLFHRQNNSCFLWRKLLYQSLWWSHGFCLVFSCSKHLKNVLCSQSHSDSSPEGRLQGKYQKSCMEVGKQTSNCIKHPKQI